jgi:hypothetical protein
MPVLQLNDRSYPLNSGTNRVGGGSESEVQVAEDPSLGVQALIDVDGTGRAMIRRSSDASNVRVNGVALGAEPTPLLHGDRVEIGAVELSFADDEKGGATQFASAAEIAEMVKKRTGAARATTATGGRMVSLVDGKEYTVADEGIIIGREAGCDVVVPVAEVSRKHAEIRPDDTGYLLFDHSSNGVFVNGERIQGSRRLARADVIRIGNEDFRFYADVAPSAPRSSGAPAQVPGAGAPAVSGSGAGTPGAPAPQEGAASAPQPAGREAPPREDALPAAGLQGAGAPAPAAPSPAAPAPAAPAPAAPAPAAPAPAAPAPAAPAPAAPAPAAPAPAAAASAPAAPPPAAPTPPESPRADASAPAAPGSVDPAAPRRPRPPLPPASDDSGTRIPAWAWLLVIVALVAVAGFILLSS